MRNWYKETIGAKQTLLLALQNQNYWLYDVTCKLQSCQGRTGTAGLRGGRVYDL